MSSTPDSNEKVREYFCGIAVIIDDKVNNEQDPDYCSNKIFKALQDANMPVVSYEKLPEEEAYPSIAKASMIILDWQLSDIPNEISSLGAGGFEDLQKSSEDNKLKFLEKIIKRSTVPVFIISANIPKARRDIEGRPCLKREIENRIFLTNKTDLSKEPKDLFNQFFTFLSEWLEEKHALYALKEWELVADKARSDMYHDFSQSSWADIMWNRIKQDVNAGKDESPEQNKQQDVNAGKDESPEQNKQQDVNGGKDESPEQNKLLSVREEFGEFITRNIINRFGEFKFEDSRFTQGAESDKELYKVLAAEQFISTKSHNDGSGQSLRTGNLYIGSTGEYFLIITADCDLARANEEQYIFCLRGEGFKKKNIAPAEVRIKPKPTSNEGKSNESLKKQSQITKEKEPDYLIKMWDAPRQLHGVIHSESQKKYYLPAVDGKVIKFDLSIKVKTQDSLKDMDLKGRVASPYIEQIQQAAAKWMIRQGNLPFPEEYFQV